MGANEDENIKLIKQRKRKMNVKKKTCSNGSTWKTLASSLKIKGLEEKMDCLLVDNISHYYY